MHRRPIRSCVGFTGVTQARRHVRQLHAAPFTYAVGRPAAGRKNRLTARSMPTRGSPFYRTWQSTRPSYSLPLRAVTTFRAQAALDALFRPGSRLSVYLYTLNCSRSLTTPSPHLPTSLPFCLPLGSDVSSGSVSSGCCCCCCCASSPTTRRCVCVCVRYVRRS